MPKSVYDFEEANIFPAPSDIPPFWVQMCGISHCDKTYRIDRNISDVAVIEYIIKGKGTLQINGNTYHPQKGDIYIIPMGSKHTYFTDPTDPWEKIYLNIQGNAVTHLLKAYRLDEITVFSGCEELYPIFSEMYDRSGEDIPVDDIMEQCCMLFNKLLIRMNKLVFKGDSVSAEAKQIKDYIDINLCNDIKISSLSSLIFRSNDYVNKIFKKSYGVTPHSYYINSKIDAAKALLLNTSMTIRQISEHLGYTDVHYFLRQFRKVNGISPGEYRKNKDKMNLV